MPQEHWLTFPINENSPKHTRLVKVNTTEINTYALIWYVIIRLMFFYPSEMDKI